MRNTIDESREYVGKNITAIGVKASYDSACKRLLANKVILAWIMKSCLEEYVNCSIQEIMGRYIEGEPEIGQVPVNMDEKVLSEQIETTSVEDNSVYEGTVSYDIRFYANTPDTGERNRLIINIEAQNDFYPGYPIVKRGIYYCSRMVSSQYGVEFTESHYDRIKKVYSIWICMNPPKYRRNSINRYFIKEEKLIGDVSERKENYDLITTVMICLGESNDKNSFGVLRLLEVLLSSERDVEEKRKFCRKIFRLK